jgi:tRNA(fMet)-specific endonuclease VapC
MQAVSAIVVDTSSWVSYFSGHPLPELESALQESRVHVPPIVIAELMSGRLTVREESAMIDLLESLPVCETPRTHWIRVGRLRRKLSQVGLTVSTPDAHVAQCCLDLRAGLLTQDRIFSRIARHAPLGLVG